MRTGPWQQPWTSEQAAARTPVCGRRPHAGVLGSVGWTRAEDGISEASSNTPPRAGVAQLVEQLIRNQQVSGSSPLAGSTNTSKYGSYSTFS